jgi:hypothetical protein
MQDGLKAHEEGHHHHHQNPFDIFSNFFGGRASCSSLCVLLSFSHKMQIQDIRHGVAPHH